MKSNLLRVYSSSLSNLLLNSVRQLSTEGIKVKPHIPLIQFRKGGNSKLSNSEHSLSSTAASTSAGGLDEDMTPIKYRRKTLTPLEMEAIEQGGCY